MPVLANTHCRDRHAICEGFLPFARPDYVEGMIIGDDLDSLLSAMFLQARFGWPIVGVYCQYTWLWHTSEAMTWQQKLLSGRFFAVDLDIYHAAVPSLGHHIIALKPDDQLPGHSHTLNPNALFGLAIHHFFRKKYPLATLHLLRWLFNDRTRSDNSEALCWLADSAFINAQHYRYNVADWISTRFDLPAFGQIFPVLQTVDFECFMSEKILSPMKKNALCRPSRSTYKSQHLGLNGFQCQFNNPNTENGHLQHLLDILADLSGMPRLVFPKKFEGSWEGVRTEASIAEIGPDFDAWLSQTDVFSYAFTFKDRLNFTRIPTLSA
jgi:hypothetical protein